MIQNQISNHLIQTRLRYRNKLQSSNYQKIYLFTTYLL